MLFFFSCYRDHLNLHSFPTRRSSDLKRTSFLRKNLRIDVTCVTGDPQDQDCDDENQYQIELELLSVPESKNELFNMVYKVFDVLKIMT